MPMTKTAQHRSRVLVLVAALACGLSGCNKSVPPTVVDEYDGVVLTQGSGSHTSSGNLQNRISGSWKHAYSDGQLNPDSLVLTFGAALDYSMVWTPAAKSNRYFREEKGSYEVSSDSIYMSPSSRRESIDGKSWTDVSFSNYYYRVSLSDTSMTLSNSSSYYFYVR